MSRKVVATPLFKKNLTSYLDHYVDVGAVRYIERIWNAYTEMLETIAAFEKVGKVRRRNVHGTTVTLREYLLEVEPRNFLILYRVPPDPDQPIILLNIRIGGQNSFKWQ